MGGRGASSQKATNARTIDNMNETQLKNEIAKNDGTIKKLKNQLEKFTVKDEYKDQFPLGVGFRSDKKYVKNIENAVKNASEYTKIYNKIEDLQTRNKAYQNALKSIKGTGKTQSEVKKSTINKIASTSQTKWTKSKISGGTAYKSGEYTINNVEGTSFIYRNNQRIGMSNTLKSAKAFVDIYKKELNKRS